MTDPASSKIIINKGLYFKGGGIFYYWQAGFCEYLQTNKAGNFESNFPVVGSSAGALSAALLLSNADFREATSFVVEQVSVIFYLYK